MIRTPGTRRACLILAAALGMAAAGTPAARAASAQALSAAGRLDSRPPAATLLFPVGGEELAAAAPETLRWRVEESSVVGAPPLRLSILAGTAEVWADSVAGWTAGEGLFACRLPDLDLPQARLVLRATDAYGLSAADTSDAFALRGALTDAPDAGPPARDAVGPAAPNPFNPRTTIPFTLARPADVELAVHDLAGRRVALLREGALPAGRHEATWDGRDAAGRACPSGTYLATLRTRGGPAGPAARLTLIK